MSVAAETGTASPAWIRGRVFDLNFILGIAGLALASGAAVLIRPDLFVPILIADLWLLGYHHVVATYTRLAFDRESFRQHRFLVLGLPPLVIAGVGLAAAGLGLWALATVYLYWQWWHYTRQSWGVAQVYRRKARGLADDNEMLAKLAFYLLPLWGILHRSHQAPDQFLGLELKVLPVPGAMVDVVGAAALVMLGWWVAGRVWMWWQGRLPLAHTLYVGSHFVIFYVSYIAIGNIDVGWLVVNVWHNAQYIAFVWLYNNNRFRAGIDPKARFLSMLSQSGNMWRYLLVCLGISTVAYLALQNAAVALPVAVVIYQAINFHHYIVDSVIWKVRRRSLQKTLGIAA